MATLKLPTPAAWRWRSEDVNYPPHLYTYRHVGVPKNGAMSRAYIASPDSETLRLWIVDCRSSKRLLTVDGLKSIHAAKAQAEMFVLRLQHDAGELPAHQLAAAEAVLARLMEA